MDFGILSAEPAARYLTAVFCMSASNYFYCICENKKCKSREYPWYILAPAH